MRINLKFKVNKQLVLPIQHNHMLQAMILNYLGNEEYQKFIHDEGYSNDNRAFKLFTFSRLQGRFNIDSRNNKIIYYDEVNLILSSADNRLLQYFVNNNIMSDKGMRLGDNTIYLSEIKTIDKKYLNKDKFYTKSPITVYSTLSNGEKKKTYYYSPYEQEFEKLIRQNLIKKYEALYEKKPENTEFTITPASKNRLKERITIYKGFVIKAWSGEFILEGSKELIDIAYDTGLGSKNSQGFGCIEVCS